ncbi:hypothetical protein N474_08525 [Pseudoalteromonas luteoviolacea CPMOR-2]|nr:hypothetical protein N474_08525 [Pseudoalteromonas luteoviolacea CPMOR-2]
MKFKTKQKSKTIKFSNATTAIFIVLISLNLHAK